MLRRRRHKAFSRFMETDSDRTERPEFKIKALFLLMFAV
jgi:hypothetical protein